MESAPNLVHLVVGIALAALFLRACDWCCFGSRPPPGSAADAAAVSAAAASAGAPSSRDVESRELDDIMAEMHALEAEIASLGIPTEVAGDAQLPAHAGVGLTKPSAAAAAKRPPPPPPARGDKSSGGGGTGGASAPLASTAVAAAASGGGGGIVQRDVDAFMSSAFAAPYLRSLESKRTPPPASVKKAL